MRRVITSMLSPSGVITADLGPKCLSAPLHVDQVVFLNKTISVLVD